MSQSTNTGSATLNISSIAASGDFAPATSTKPCGSTLAAGANCIIKVTFTPTQLGTRTGNITITDNASNSPQTVPLSGTGIAPVTLTPTSATYAAQTVGTTSLPKTFTLKNNQSVTLSQHRDLDDRGLQCLHDDLRCESGGQDQLHHQSGVQANRGGHEDGEVERRR